MGSHGIYVHSLRKELLPTEAARRPQDRSSALFAEILPPSTINAAKSGSLKEVIIKMQCGINVIGCCDASSLGGTAQSLEKLRRAMFTLSIQSRYYLCQRFVDMRNVANGLYKQVKNGKRIRDNAFSVCEKILQSCNAFSQCDMLFCNRE